MGVSKMDQVIERARRMINQRVDLRYDVTHDINEGDIVFSNILLLTLRKDKIQICPLFHELCSLTPNRYHATLFKRYYSKMRFLEPCIPSMKKLSNFDLREFTEYSYDKKKMMKTCKTIQKLTIYADYVLVSCFKILENFNQFMHILL
jgi:hypothetical protein